MSDLYNEGRTSTAGDIEPKYDVQKVSERDKHFQSLESLIMELILNQTLS